MYVRRHSAIPLGQRGDTECCVGRAHLVWLQVTDDACDVQEDLLHKRLYLAGLHLWVDGH